MDFKIALACILIAGGAIGAILPAGDEQASNTPEGSTANGADSAFTPEARIALAQQPVDRNWGDEVVLERHGDGHFYADVLVDGRSYSMLVDTGATVVALTGEDAAAMGLQWFEDEIVPVAQGANGPVEGVNATIDRMNLGEHEASGVRAIIIPEGAGISLLGQSFLSTIGRVEISGDRMILGS